MGWTSWVSPHTAGAGFPWVKSWAAFGADVHAIQGDCPLPALGQGMFVPVACGCSRVRKYISTWRFCSCGYFFACIWHSYRLHASGCTRSPHMLLQGTSVAAGVPRDPWACWAGSRGISAAVPAAGQSHGWVLGCGSPGNGTAGSVLPRPRALLPLLSICRASRSKSRFGV